MRISLQLAASTSYSIIVINTNVTIPWQKGCIWIRRSFTRLLVRLKFFLIVKVIKKFIKRFYLVKLGLQLAHEVVSGSNARCIAFLAAFRHFIADYKAPDSATRPISKDLEVKLKPNIK